MRMKKSMEQHSVNGVSMANGSVSFRSVTLNVYSFAIDGIIIDAGASALKKAFSLSGNNSRLMLYIAPISMKTIQAAPLGLNNNCMFRFTCTNLLFPQLGRLATIPFIGNCFGASANRFTLLRFRQHSKRGTRTGSVFLRLDTPLTTLPS